MNTTILTDDQIIAILEQFRPTDEMPDSMAHAITVSRAIERAAIEADRKRRGEPVGYLVELDGRDTYVSADRTVRDAHLTYGWRPVYDAPQPADPMRDALKEMQRFFGKWPEFVPADEYISAASKAVQRMNAVLSNTPASAHAEPVNSGALTDPKAPDARMDTGAVGGAQNEPVKVPSDEEICSLAKNHLSAHAQFVGTGEVWYEGEVEFARALLARYGQPTHQE